MASVDGEDGATDAAAVRPRPDRRAEALRANLKRRKAQARARDEGRPAEPGASSGAPGRDG